MFLKKIFTGVYSVIKLTIRFKLEVSLLIKNKLVKIVKLLSKMYTYSTICCKNLVFKNVNNHKINQNRDILLNLTVFCKL
jgi:hypothetical protein